MLDAEIKQQLSQYMPYLEGDIVLKISAGDDQVSQNMLDLVNELSAMPTKIKAEKAELTRTPSFSVNRPGEETGIVFAGLPLGHEFTSLVLALIQVSGRPPKVEEHLIHQIKNVQGEHHFETYVSLTCNNCPDVVQALNIMSVLNPNITHTMIEGSAFQKEVDEKNILAVPTVYLNGEFFESGRMNMNDILTKIGSVSDGSELADKDPYDVLVVGGGPAGASAAVYAARKGIRTGMVMDRFGGQVMDTIGIENFISTKYTEGPRLAAEMEGHVAAYDVDVMTSQRAKSLKKNNLIEVELENGAILQGKTVILATGARWRKIGVPGEEEFRNKGVTYCPHCDGPMFKGKHVAVIGGGNSGIEAAIDLAGLVNHVTVLEFAAELKADSVLQNRINSLPNATVITNAETKEITGGDSVNRLTYVDRQTDETKQIDVQGVSVQIGLIPNTEWLDDVVQLERGEIVIDKHGATNIPGVFAAGDCTDTPYKQIVISVGAGATAALGAFDYLIRH